MRAAEKVPAIKNLRSQGSRWPFRLRNPLRALRVFRHVCNLARNRARLFSIGCVASERKHIDQHQFDRKEPFFVQPS